MPKRRSDRSHGTMGGWALLVGCVILGGNRQGFAESRPYHFDYRAQGPRCLPKLVFSGKRHVYLWMRRRPACRPIQAILTLGQRTTTVPVYRERPYWVIRGHASRFTLRLATGRIVVRVRSMRDLARSNRSGASCPGKTPEVLGFHANPVRLPHGCGSEPASRQAPGRYRVAPGSARAQVARWARRAHLHLAWAAPDWMIPARLGLPGPLPTALRLLLLAGQRSTGLCYAFSEQPDTHELRVYLASSPPSRPDPRWTITPGALHAQLLEWVRRAGYQLIWHAPNDYLLTARATLHGSFLRAISILVKTLDAAGSPIRVTVYRKNRVLVVAGGA